MKYLYKVFFILSIVALLFGGVVSLAQANADPYATINEQNITGDGATIAVPPEGGSVDISVYAYFPQIADEITIKGLMSSSGIQFYVDGVQNKGTLTLTKDGPGSIAGGTEARLNVTVTSTGGFGGYLSFPLEVSYYTNNTLESKVIGKLNIGERENLSTISLYPENRNVTLGKAGDFLLREWVFNNSSDDPIGTVNLKHGYTPSPRTVDIKAPTSESYKDISVRVDLEITDNSALADTRYTAVIGNTTGSNDSVRVTPNPERVDLSRSSGTNRFYATEYLTLRVYRSASVGYYPITFTATYDSGRGEFTRSETITIHVFEDGGSWQPVDLFSADPPVLSIVNDGAYNIQGLSLLKLTANYVNPFTGKFALLSGLGESAPGDPGVYFQPNGYSPDAVRIQASYKGNTVEGLVTYTCPYCIQFDGKQNDVVEKGESTTFEVVRQDRGNLYTTQNWNWAPRAIRNGIDVTGTEITFSNVYSNGQSAFFTVTPTNAAQIGGQYKLHLYTKTLPNTPDYSVPQFAHPNASRTVIAEAIADLGVSAPNQEPYSLLGSVSDVDTEVVRTETNVHTHTLTLQKENIASVSATIGKVRDEDLGKEGGDTIPLTPPEVNISRITSSPGQDVYYIYVDTSVLTDLGNFSFDVNVSATSTSGQSISETYSGSFRVIENEQPSYSFTLSPATREVTIPQSGTTQVSYDIFVTRTGDFPALTPDDFVFLLGLNDRGISPFPSSGDWSVRYTEAQDLTSRSSQPDFVLTIKVPSDAIATPVSGDTFSLLASKNGIARSAQATLVIKDAGVPQNVSLTITPDNRNVTVPTTGTVSTTYNVNIIRPQDVDAFSVSDLSIDSLLPGITGSFAPNTRARVGENEQQFTLTLTVAPNTPGSSSGMEDIFTVAVEDVGGNVLDSDDSAITLTKNVVVQGITLSMPAQKNIKGRTGNVMIVSFPITAVRTGNVGTLSPENFSLSPDPLADGVTHSFTNTSWSDCDNGSAPAGSSCHLVTFSVPSSIANDSYPFTVTASRSGVSGSAQSVLNVSDIPPPPPPPSLVTCTIAANPSSGNDPLSSTLTMTARGGVAPYTYNIDADGDGTWESSGSSPSYTHTYSQGSYTARGQVIDALGDRGICSTPVTVNAPIEPLACTLSASKTEGIVPLWTQFTLSATGGSGTKSYQIDPGDGRPSYSVAQHTHDYRTSGIYTAVGTVSDDSGSTSCDVTIRAYDLGGGETNPGGN